MLIDEIARTLGWNPQIFASTARREPNSLPARVMILVAEVERREALQCASVSDHLLGCTNNDVSRMIRGRHV